MLRATHTRTATSSLIAARSRFASDCVDGQGWALFCFETSSRLLFAPLHPNIMRCGQLVASFITSDEFNSVTFLDLKFTITQPSRSLKPSNTGCLVLAAVAEHAGCSFHHLQPLLLHARIFSPVSPRMLCCQHNTLAFIPTNALALSKILNPCYHSKTQCLIHHMITNDSACSA